MPKPVSARRIPTYRKRETAISSPPPNTGNSMAKLDEIPMFETAQAEIMRVTPYL